MDTVCSYRIDANAAQALAEWKAFFAEQVAVNAKELAKKDKSQGVIVLFLPRTEGGETTVFVQELDVGKADAA